MTAAHSEKRPDKAAPFHLAVTAGVQAYAAEYGAWNSAENDQDRGEYPEAQWPIFEAVEPGVKPNSGWAEITEQAATAKPIEFAHASEQEFARMLDAREIRWRYKSRTFAVEWDEEGNFVDCFTPDFYLSVHDMYIALIAPDCSESNAKARNVKLLRQHHPEIRIEIVNTSYLLH